MTLLISAAMSASQDMLSVTAGGMIGRVMTFSLVMLCATGVTSLLPVPGVTGFAADGAGAH